MTFNEYRTLKVNDFVVANITFTKQNIIRENSYKIIGFENHTNSIYGTVVVSIDKNRTVSIHYSFLSIK